jgi:hypothetical protein
LTLIDVIRKGIPQEGEDDSFNIIYAALLKRLILHFLPLEKDLNFTIAPNLNLRQNHAH